METGRYYDGTSADSLTTTSGGRTLCATVEALVARKVAVIGGGVIGLLSAYALRRRGVEVVLVDRARFGSGCSHGNAGWICPSISTPVPNPALRGGALLGLLRAGSPLYISPTAAPSMAPWLWMFWRSCAAEVYERGASALLSMAADACDRYRSLADDGVEFELHQDGLLMIFDSRDALEDELDLLARTDYQPVRRLSPEQLRDLQPGLRAGTAGGLHVLSECHVRAEQLCAGLAESCRAMGVETRCDFAVEALEIDSDGGRLRATAIRGPAGRVEADAFVIATGAEAGSLAARCGTRLPLQAGKGYSITVEQPALDVPRPLYLAERKLAVTPFAGGLRISGTMELSGINTRLDPRRLGNIRRAAARSLPGALQGAAQHEWVGMRPMTPDGLPVMGRLPQTGNVYVNSGHQMLGITLAPVAGEAIASAILDLAPPPNVDLAAFAPDRFGSSGGSSAQPSPATR